MQKVVFDKHFPLCKIIYNFQTFMLMCQQFLLANLSECDKVKAVLLKKFPDSVYDLNPNLLLITNDTKTTADIDNLVNFSRADVGFGIITHFDYVKGFFDPDLWEWLKARANV